MDTGDKVGIKVVLWNATKVAITNIWSVETKTNIQMIQYW